MSASRFGLNTKLINDFSRRLELFPWFTRIETPHPEDSTLKRVTLEFLLDEPSAPWNGATDEAELRIDRHIIDSSRLPEQYYLLQAFRVPWSIAQTDTILGALLHRYPGYYKRTGHYAYELLDFPERMIRYALLECLVDDLAPRITFFRSLMGWFEQGYWPCGWSGDHPEGQLILL